jgi:hypothetical protein
MKTDQKLCCNFNEGGSKILIQFQIPIEVVMDFFKYQWKIKFAKIKKKLFLNF